MITHDGRTLSLIEWAQATGLHHNTIAGRLGKGWTVKKALTTAP